MLIDFYFESLYIIRKINYYNMKWTLTEMLFMSIWVTAFIFVVGYYFCVVNKLNHKNWICRFFCCLSVRTVVVWVQMISMVLGYLGCKLVASRFVPSPTDVTQEEWNIFLFTTVYCCSGFFILCGGRIIAKKIGHLS